MNAAARLSAPVGLRLDPSYCGQSLKPPRMTEPSEKPIECLGTGDVDIPVGAAAVTPVSTVM